MEDDPQDVATNSKKPTPWIACFQSGLNEPTYFLIIERNIVADTKTFSKAVVVWFLSHYIYNIEYAREIKEVATFFQEFIFTLPSQEKKSANYLSATTGIKSFIA